jgi:beta-1,4-mannosyl-glycoprotein beta-1,4-N-acetylglucosaminyltransferase
MTKIIDCFTFFNELDLLEIRLKYLSEVVDYFVIVEADTSHNGEPKQMVFRDNMDRYKPFIEKIIYVQIKMENFENKNKVAWKREGYQRNQIKVGIEKLNLSNSDLVLISDVDEIPNKEILSELKFNGKNNVQFKKLTKLKLISRGVSQSLKYAFYRAINKDISAVKSQLKLIYTVLFKDEEPPVNFKMHNFFYYLNFQQKNTFWSGTQCIQARLLKKFTANEIRGFRKAPLETVFNGGWHFSYLGGKEMIKYKIQNFAHQEYNIPEILSDEYIDHCINNGYSIFEYFKNPNIKPEYIKRDISHLPQDLKHIAVNYRDLIYQV